MLAIVVMTKNADFFNTLTPSEQADFLAYQQEKQQHINERQQRLIPTLTDEILQAFVDYQHPKLNLSHNPTNLTNPYWQWVIQHQLNPYDILDVIPNINPALAEKRNFGEYSPTDTLPPLWSFQRMGQSCTLLPDGRAVLIGGEFDDFYDPNFCIFNDVVVKHPDGKIEIFGYPSHIFPPTDFHTATLIGDEIFIIGSMGYFDQRCYEQTPIFKLNIHTFKIERVESRNHIGWINEHTATAKDGQIIIQNGRVFDNDHSPMRENINTWAFNPKTLIFKNISQLKWQGFWVHRKDLDYLVIDDLKSFITNQQIFPDKDNSEMLAHLTEKIGKQPDFALLEQLFCPPLAHEVATDDNDIFNTVTIWIDDIKVRYVIDYQYIQVYVEGLLSDEKLELLQVNLCHKLSKLENSPCEVKPLSLQ